MENVKESLIYEVKQEVGNVSIENGEVLLCKNYKVVMRTPDFDVAKDKVLRLINKGIKSHMVGTPTGVKQ